MSLLTVENVSHGFGARQILENASFRLLKGEHIGLVGANGEGKSTFLNIITGKIRPDEGKVTWSRHVTTGYLDQHSALAGGMTIRQALRGAFDHMYELEKEMLGLYDAMASADADKIDEMMEEAGEIQQILEAGGFYQLDAKIEEVAGGLGLLSVGLDRDVAELSGGQRTKVLLAILFLGEDRFLLIDEPTNHLDLHGREVLSRYLRGKRGYLLVSHDRAFLDGCVDHILAINRADITLQKGNFSTWWENKQRQDAFELAQDQRLRKDIRRLESAARQSRAWADRVESEKIGAIEHRERYNEGGGRAFAPFAAPQGYTHIEEETK